MQGLKWAAHEMHFRGDVGQGSENWCLCQKHPYVLGTSSDIMGPSSGIMGPSSDIMGPSSDIMKSLLLCNNYGNRWRVCKRPKIKPTEKEGFQTWPILSLFLFFLPPPSPPFLPFPFLPFPFYLFPLYNPPSLLLSSGSYSPGYMNSLNSQCWSWCLDLPVSASLVLGL